MHKILILSKSLVSAYLYLPATVGIGRAAWSCKTEDWDVNQRNQHVTDQSILYKLFKSKYKHFVSACPVIASLLFPRAVKG